MIRLMIAAERSGAGKTAVSCALLRALQRRGRNPCSFKCGPDYIDPMFHRVALGLESHSLDLFLMDRRRLRTVFADACVGHGAAVCEGAMGYYDGVGGTEVGSAWNIAGVLDLPVIMVLSVEGAGLTLAAELRGLLDFRSPSHIIGVLLNKCTPKRCEELTPKLERETGVPVLGCLPPSEAGNFPSRHLGLYTAGEVKDLSDRLDTMAELLEQNVDMRRLISLCEGRTPLAFPSQAVRRKRTYIAVAWDEAFCFCYADTLQIMHSLGAEFLFFSPMDSYSLPEQAEALYLPGGYPELHARKLSENRSMRNSVVKAVRNGMPTVAECGGFLYLSGALRDTEGTTHNMCGVFPGAAADAGRLVRVGYATLCPDQDSMLFRAGERIPIHEFHRWESTACGEDIPVEKAGHRYRCGFATDTLYAGFPHLCFAGQPELAERFVEAAWRYGGR